VLASVAVQAWPYSHRQVTSSRTKEGKGYQQCISKGKTEATVVFSLPRKVNKLLKFDLSWLSRVDLLIAKGNDLIVVGQISMMELAKPQEIRHQLISLQTNWKLGCCEEG
jgi:hypothetical protein